MKVVKRGTRSIPWYIGRQSTCPRCGTIVEFDGNDKHKVTQRNSRFGAGGEALTFTCPGCGKPCTESVGPDALFWAGRAEATTQANNAKAYYEK